MNSKRTIIGLIGFLAVLLMIFAALFFLQKGASLNTSKKNTLESQTPKIKPIAFKPTDPATMAVSTDQSQVTWTIKGQFVKPFTPKGDFYIGHFVVFGDTSSQELPFWIGPKNTPILISTPTYATESNAPITWTQYPLETINSQVPLNQAAKIYISNQISDEVIPHITKLNNFWVSINNQIQTEGKVTVPDDISSFWLYTNKVGL